MDAGGAAISHKHFLVKARIAGCKKLLGIRPAVYMMAQKHCGRYNESKEKTIFYVGDDLEIAVAFGMDRQADAERFRNMLDLWHLETPLLGLQGRITVEVEMPVVELTNIILVFLSDYNAEDSDSPMVSLANFKAAPASDSSIASEISVNNPLVSFQSLEKVECFGVLNAYKMHLKDKANSKKLAGNENNILLGSWQCHQYLDGLHTADGLPQMAVGFLSADDCAKTVGGQKRYRIDVTIEFRSDQAEEQMVGNLKDGSFKQEERKWKSFVHVQDKTTFIECLQWKYVKTKGEWASADAL